MITFSKPVCELSKRKLDVRALLWELRIRELVVEDAFELARGLWGLKELARGEISESPPGAKLTDVFLARIVPVGPVGLRLSSSC